MLGPSGAMGIYLFLFIYLFLYVFLQMIHVDAELDNAFRKKYLLTYISTF